MTSTKKNIQISDDLTCLGNKVRRIEREEAFKRTHVEKFESLNPEELRVMTLLAGGLEISEVARKLSISPFIAACVHIRIKRKLGARSYGQLLQYALAFDLI